MKKILSLILSAIICLSLVACSSANTKTSNAPSIKPSEFSAETTTILNLFDDEIMFFDFTVDETIKSCSVNVFNYIDDEWKEIGSMQSSIQKTDNQIAVKINEDSYEVFVIDESGHSAYTSPEVDFSFDETTAQLWSKFSNPQDIVIGEEIQLFAKIGNNGNNLSLDGNFREADCTQGFAITITFFDEDMK